MFLNKNQFFFSCFTFILVICISCSCKTNNRSDSQQNKNINTDISISKRVKQLLSQMTLEEKVAQLQSIHPGPNRLNVNADFLNDSEKMEATFKNGIGMVNYVSSMSLKETIQFRNRLQDYLKHKTRLGIPTIFLDEAHHGLMQPKSTVFPQAIGLSCSWDPELIEKVYDFVAKEAHSRGTKLVLAPVIDVCRDPRWGRVGETLGEDPYLCGILGSAMVTGFQGSNTGEISKDHVAATLKHFAGHGQPEGGLNQAPANYSERTLREFHLEPFRLCIQQAKPACVMASYNEIDGIPSHANKWLLKSVLHKEFGFQGVVVSDWFGIDQLWNKHFVAEDEKSAALLAFKAGITIDLPYGVNYQHLTALVNEHKISLTEIDKAVAKILTLKFKLGLFEKSTFNLLQAKKISSSTIGEKLALEAAEKSIVLLKNEKQLLPIGKNQFKRISIIGPCAATTYFGDYSGTPIKSASILDAVKNKVGKSCEIVYSKGCNLISNNHPDSLKTNRKNNLKLIQKAVTDSKNSDFIIVAIGENEFMCRESYGSDHLGDNYTLNLLQEQNELVKALSKLKKPMLVYLMHARPLAINWISKNVPAILDGFYMGQETGNAFANILFGDVCPSGKTTITWPRNEGQIPMYYNHKPSAKSFDYLNVKSSPLYPFGFGLSYTNFSYSNLRISEKTMKKNGSVTISIDLQNTGKRKGDEIIQLYIRDKVSSVTRPIKELKDFKRIYLNPNETKTVYFKIDQSKLAFWTSRMKHEVEAGEFEVFVGSSSVKLQSIHFRYM